MSGLAWLALGATVLIVVGGCLLAAGVGVPLVAKPEMQDAARLGAHLFTRAVVPALLLWTAAEMWIVRKFVRPEGVRAFRAASAAVLFFLVYHAAVRPGLDPMRDMSTGAREIAALVPADEPILALQPDETTRAFVPFYTGRQVEDAPKIANVMAAVESGRAKHLVVMDKREEMITPELRARLVLLKNVRVNASRSIGVYAVRAP
jgi:hypothetical protein